MPSTLDQGRFAAGAARRASALRARSSAGRNAETCTAWLRFAIEYSVGVPAPSDCEITPTTCRMSFGMAHEQRPARHANLEPAIDAKDASRAYWSETVAWTTTQTVLTVVA
jgi:hypothetical protein